ncbi:MAG: dihydroorotate dehydrogenase electron transfer subunit [Peptococcaceae bacterium]|nr:dihydroorotate dehydrogenase electron transfer subunit [Peptococcaceae bacterium]
MFNSKYEIEENYQVFPGHYLMAFKSLDIARTALPGQFLHIRCYQGTEPILRRPLSIHSINKEKNLVYILYRVCGRGTGLLSGMKAGEMLDVLGPLGNGFTMPKNDEKIVLMGGGIGAAPLFFLLEEIKTHFDKRIDKVSVFLGAANSDLIVGKEKINKMGFSGYYATDDGSSGFKGTVIDLFETIWTEGSPDRIYACGPSPMFRSLAEAADKNARIEVSVEEHMGCGLGVCLSCVCKVAGPGTSTENAHICVDGPVFDLRKIIF